MGEVSFLKLPDKFRVGLRTARAPEVAGSRPSYRTVPSLRRSSACHRDVTDSLLVTGECLLFHNAVRPSNTPSVVLNIR
jgi:hypothetical protein